MAKQDPLDPYWQKRRFDVTPEPKGSKGAKARPRQQLSYLIQKHAATRLHYDFRLELDGVLKSWAVTKGPSLDPADKRLAVRTEDHPIEYGAFEGIIPKGQYGGGTVMLWDRGHWEPVDDPHKGLAKGKLSFILHGERLHGRWALVRMRNNPKEKRENWLLIKDGDDAADRERDVTQDYDISVASGRSMEEITGGLSSRVWTSDRGEKPTARGKKGKCPAFIEPQLATLVDAAPDGDWIYEMKFDGYRALIGACRDEVRFYSRNGHDWTDRLPKLAAAARRLALDNMLLDGEVVALDSQGRSSFSALQQTLKAGKGALAFFAFDLLVAKGRDIRSRTTLERKEMLCDALGQDGRKGPIYYTDHLDQGGDDMLRSLCGAGFEGIIAKRANAPYRSGRSKSWLKIKCGRQQEFVIIGMAPSERDRAFSSLLMGYYDEGRLTYAGKVGSGYSEWDLAELSRRLDKLRRSTPPIDEKLPGAITRGVRWTEPKLVAEVAFAEFTHDGSIRHGRFLGLREDKDPRDVRREEARSLQGLEDMPTPSPSSRAAAPGGKVVVAGIALSNPDKVLYPKQGLTKQDLADYLEAAAPHMLPHIAKRLVSFVRCPEGRRKNCFFQRHAGPGLLQEIRRKRVKSKDGGSEEYLYIEDVAGLVAAAQIGVLELHIWGSRIDAVDKPDRIVFDLDPAEDLPFSAVKSAAFHMRDLLDALGLQSFAMLTGGKGVHVIAPITRRHEWPTIKAFTQALAQRMAESDPDRFIANMSKSKRKGRIFVDYLRNDRSSTAICPLSPRAREGAPVAWPVSWDALEAYDTASAITMPAARRRLAEAAAAWPDYFQLRQSLTKAALSALGLA